MRVLIGGITLLSLSGLVLASAQNFPMLLAAAMVAGMGNSVFHPADFTLLNRRVSPRRGWGMRFRFTGCRATLAGRRRPVLMIAVASAWGWRASGVAASIVGMLALAFLFANRSLLQDAPLAVVESKHATGGTFAFLGVPVVWMCFVFFFFTVMAFGVLQNFAAPIFEKSYGFSLGLATSGLTAYLLGSAAGTGTGGFFATQGDRQDTQGGNGAIRRGAVRGRARHGEAPGWGVVVLMGIMGFGAGFSGPSRDMLVRRAATSTFGPAAYGRIAGFVYSGIDVGLASAPLVFGPLMDAGRYTHVLWGVAVLQTLAIATALTVGSRSRT